MYDSFFTKCPKCGKELEFQSKSGACGLYCYGKGQKDGPLLVYDAIGLDGDVILCQFCNAHIQFELLNKMPKARFKLKLTKQDYRYRGNYNPDHPDSIKEQKRLKKLFAMYKGPKTKKDLGIVNAQINGTYVEGDKEIKEANKSANRIHKNVEKLRRMA